MEQVERDGKLWSKVLNGLHEKHIATDISDPNKIRKHFNDLSNKDTSILNKPFEIPRFKADPKRTKAENSKLEAEHKKKYEVLEKVNSWKTSGRS